MKNILLLEEIKRIKKIMSHKDNTLTEFVSESQILLNEDDENTKTINLAVEFDSGMWKEKSLKEDPKLKEQLNDATKWINQKSNLIKQSGGVIDGKGKVLAVQIVASESLVPNKDGEDVNKPRLAELELSQRRSNTIKTYLTNYFKNLLKSGAIAEIPTFESPKLLQNGPEWNGEDPKLFKKHQYVQAIFKLIPPSACLEGLTIEVIYNKDPNGEFPCRGGHRCDDAEFDVLLNNVKLDGVANLNNYSDGGSRSATFVVTPQQALAISGNKPSNIKIFFECKYKDRRCHSSTPEIRLSRGDGQKTKTVIYHECTPSIQEDNDYKKIFVMELDPCGNIIRTGQENKAKQKDEHLMTPPVGTKMGWLVYDITKKSNVLIPPSTLSDLTENMYKKYLPLYGTEFKLGFEPAVYKGNCGESNLYGGYCLWSGGTKVKYVNDTFCGGVAYLSRYSLGSETNQDSVNGKKIDEMMRNYKLDYCDTSGLELSGNDIIRVSSDEMPTTWNFKRLYSPMGIMSDPKIITNTSMTPYKLVPDAKPNGVNFTPKAFTEFVKLLNQKEKISFGRNYSDIVNSDSEVTDDLGTFHLKIITKSKDEKLGSTLFPNVKKIDEYVAKYNTYKNQKFTGLIYLGGFNPQLDVFFTMNAYRRYNNGVFVENEIQIIIKSTPDDAGTYGTIANRLKALNLVKVKQGRDKQLIPV